MHELSIAKSLIDLAEANLRAAEIRGRVAMVRLQVGALSGVVPDALRFGFEIATKGTLLESSTLEIEEVPAVVYCDDCAAEHPLPDLLDLRCPACASGRSRIVRGREMMLESLEMIEPDSLSESGESDELGATGSASAPAAPAPRHWQGQWHPGRPPTVGPDSQGESESESAAP